MRILGTGSAAPKKLLTNEMLSKMVETSDEWIRTRTGIVTRHIAEEETTQSLALEAAEKALAVASATGVTREQIGVVICATLSNELRCPSRASYLQRDLGLRENLLAFDLNAACSGFIYALISATRLMDENSYALVVGSEVLSHLTDYTDRSTCVLFGDGAGAVIIAPNAIDTPDDFQWVAESQGSDEALKVNETIFMDGSAVFKFAVDVLVRKIKDLAQKAQIKLADVDLFVCHQANERILRSAAKRLKLPFNRFYMNIAAYGNTSAASIPLALDEAVAAGAIGQGSKIILAGFGGGLTAGAVYFTWNN